MRTIDKYKENRLFSITLPKLREHILTQKNQQNRTVPTKEEQYLIDVAISAFNITECLDQVYFSIEMLSGFRKRKGFFMTRHDYIVFMVENFYLRLTSIFDRALRLTNLALDIGLPNRECRESTIIKNSKIKGSDIESTLKEINKIMSDFRKTRNQIAHSEAYSEKELIYIQGFYLTIDVPEMSKYKSLMKRETDNYIKVKKDELGRVTENLEKIVGEFFESLSPIIESKAESYK